MNDPVWIKKAFSYLGKVHEVLGTVDNKTILQFDKEAGHPEVQHDEVPWCAAFVAAMMAETGQKNEVPVAMRLWAPSYGQFGQHLDHPVRGCVGVKSRNGGGHVTFIIGQSGDYFLCLGGNQSDSVSVCAIPKNTFSAFRWPSGQPIPTAPLPAMSLSQAIQGASEA